MTVKQTRRASAVESIMNIIIGFTIQFFALLFIAMVLHVPLTMMQNFKIGVFMTVVSFARSYLLRRLFETLRVKGIMP